MQKKSFNQLVLAIFLFIAAAHSVSNAESLPLLWKVPSFTLTDQDGKTFSDTDLKGRVWIANFIFTRCQTLCPLMSRHMTDLQEKIKSSEIRFVSFSVDPAHDTPEVLSRYAEEYQSDKTRRHFLTGGKALMWEIATGGFRLAVGDADPSDILAGSDPILHSSRFALIDQDGNIRGFYDIQETASINQLVNDAEQLLLGVFDES